MVTEIKWVKGKHNQFIVTLPDGSKMTTNLLCETVDSMKKFSAHIRIKEYMEDGNLEDLFRKFRTGKSEPKIEETSIDPEGGMYFEDGTIKPFYDPLNRLLLKII